MPSTDTAPVSGPTWYADIRHLFTATDIQHMRGQGLDLTDYRSVRDSGGVIYSQLAAGQMPPGNAWPADQTATFLTWMKNGFPKGTAAGTAPVARALAHEDTTAGRIRKEVTALSADELAKVTAAFSGMMAKDSSDTDGYFVQAGYHWLPSPIFCQHHVPRYNPWHRAYLYGFENAMRTVPGCEDVTLPYWDITTPFPDVLKQPPFDAYTLPEPVGSGFDAGYVTQRFAYDEIATNLLKYDVVADLQRALTQTDWEDFHGLIAGAKNNAIIAAHDGGHNSIGTTMQSPEVASFDPVFWFFHANWDRLFWQWQTTMRATDLAGLLQTIDKAGDPLSYQIFTEPVLQSLDPFTKNPPELDTLAIIDSVSSLDVDYAPPQEPTTVTLQPKTRRTTPTAQTFRVQTDRVNVRVQGLNRLKIPGTFTVHLMKDGEPIASRAFFQPREVETCETCVDNAIVHFDFELPLDAVAGGTLGVVVEPADTSQVGERFPHKLMGSPTVEVHLLTTTE